MTKRTKTVAVDATLPSPTDLLDAAQSTQDSVEKRGRKSLLYPYLETIKVLRQEKKFTYKEISSFLAERGLNVHPMTVVSFASKNGWTKKRS